MSFWILAALVTFIATLVVLLPLGRTKNAAAGNALDYDKEVYKSRIAEVDRDLDMNRISPAEAEAAKAEAGRRLLTLQKDASNKGAAAGIPSGARTALTAIALLFIPAFSLWAYMVNGSPLTPDQPLAMRQSADPATQSVEQMISRVESALAKNPEDIRGWRVLAPIYLRLGRPEDGKIALRNILRLEGENAEIQAMLAETIVNTSSGVINEEARKLFESANRLAPEAVMPRFYLAVALGQEGKLPEAANAWRTLLKNAPADKQWVNIARGELREIEKQLASADPNVANDDADKIAKGPTSEDVEMARRMSGEDRMAMIEGMVENLSDRLAENPNDPAGWRQLIRSYIVLGKNDSAISAAQKAQIAMKDDEAFVGQMKQMVEQLSNTANESN